MNSALRRKKRRRDPEYLEFIHTLGCAVCWEEWRTDPGLAMPVEAHHAGLRGLGQKAPDRTAIPLCSMHHRTGPDSAHVLGKRFWEHHGLNKEKLIGEYNAAFEGR